MNVTNIKSKVVSTADKIVNSKAYKAVEKGAVLASSALMTAGVSSMSTFALGEGGIDIKVDEAAVLANAQPFLTPAVTILCIVGGIKLGWSFLKRSFH